MSIVTTCDECGDIDGYRRIWDPFDRVYVDVCPDCEPEFLKQQENDLREYHGLTPEDE